MFFLVVLTRLPLLVTDLLNIDEGVWWMAGKMLAQGAVPYVDFIENKPPGIFSLYALPHLVGLESLYWMHALAILWVSATAAAAGKAAGALSPPRPVLAGRIAALLYVFLTATGSPRQYLFFNTETGALLPFVLALWVYARARLTGDRPLPLFLSGMLVAAACMFRQPIGVAAVLLGLDLVLPSPGARRPPLSILLGAGAFALGGIALAALVAFYLFQIGALSESIYWIFTVNREHIAMHPSVEFQFRRFAVNILPSLLIGLPAWAALFWAFPKKWSATTALQRVYLAYAVLALALFWTASLAGRWNGHYYMPVLAPLSILAAALWCEPGKTARLRVAMGALALAGIAALAFSAAGAARSVQGSFEEVSLPMRQAARRIGELTRDSDKIYIWGFGQTLYYRSRRMAAGRFITPYTSISGYLFGAEEAFPGIAPQSLIIEDHWRTFMGDLRSQRPALFLDYAENDVHNFGRHPIGGFPEMAAWLRENYERLPDEGPVVFYRRKDLD